MSFSSVIPANGMTTIKRIGIVGLAKHVREIFSASFDNVKTKFRLYNFCNDKFEWMIDMALSHLKARNHAQQFFF